MTSLPPAYDDNGDVRDLNAEELYRHWAKTFLMDRAGGWDPESIPGVQARIEFEAFIRETQARAVEAHERWLEAASRANLGDPAEDGLSYELGMALGEDSKHWVHDYSGDPWTAYAEHIRQGRTDLSGNRIVT